MSDPNDRHDEGGGIPHADLLVRFVDCVVERSAELETVREELVTVTDEATMIDAAATIAAFEMMTRVADGTGTMHPAQRLDGEFVEVREVLGLDGYESARTRR